MHAYAELSHESLHLFTATSVCVLCSFASVVSEPYATLWTTACQAPLSLRFSLQEYWRGFLTLGGVFLTQVLNLCLLHFLHCRQILYC